MTLEGTEAGHVGDPGVVVGVFEDNPIMMIYMAGPEYRIVAANRAYREWIGRPDLVGSLVRDAYPEVAGQQVFELLDRVYTSGRAHTGQEWRIQVARSADGEPEEMVLDFTVTPRRDGSGEVVGLFLSSVDVTAQVRERRAAQARAEEAQRRYETAREVVAEIQRALLPAGLPVVPQAEVASSYLLAEQDLAAGGDWFDAVVVPDGRLALVVGDVVGHGVAASAVMAQLRAVLAERLAAGAGPAEALDALDRVAARGPGGRAATVCVAVLDPGTGDLSYSTAGHPPPLLLPGGREARFLAPTGAPPLGVRGASGPRAVWRDHLDVGDVLLLHTDGIVERPGRELGASTVELAQVAADAAAGRVPGAGGASPAQRVCTQTLELLVRATGHADDVTLLAVQRRAAPPALEQSVRSEPTALPVTRSALRVWLHGLGVSGADRTMLEHAVGELVTNAVEHAFTHDPAAAADARVRVRGVLTPAGTVQVEVADQGRWVDRETTGSGRGRGLTMAGELTDGLDLDRRAGGTTATVTRRVLTPARLLTVGAALGGVPRPRADPAALPDRLAVLDPPGTGGGVRLVGPIDALTAPDLRDELQRRTRGGTRPLAVDLSGVTYLASAGVAVLHELVGTGRAAPGLLLSAPPGSPADQIMTLTALPHTTAGAGADG
ncbi:SpoIIE family protein phosphatase [Pseudonocardia broussonetiae]|uniref:SpoIIE family protein phosphatase n=1 Tax=Pseudonocardia broussonetiae TaxID=2736640 RepID=A0A6M6JHD9_9PSEU|nr:SpoIIE family protein phosphatase [Pseudonocardia broussonetiae]QJY47448.1 SpoIIE family protein phosphatase [Pseudonocardia broussonetiae]